jgi:hypothetical protein
MPKIAVLYAPFVELHSDRLMADFTPYSYLESANRLLSAFALLTMLRMAEREGFEPPRAQQSKSFIERALSCL